MAVQHPDSRIGDRDEPEFVPAETQAGQQLALPPGSPPHPPTGTAILGSSGFENDDYFRRAQRLWNDTAAATSRIIQLAEGRSAFETEPTQADLTAVHMAIFKLLRTQLRQAVNFRNDAAARRIDVHHLCEPAITMVREAFQKVAAVRAEFIPENVRTRLKQSDFLKSIDTVECHFAAVGAQNVRHGVMPPTPAGYEVTTITVKKRRA